MSEILGSAAVIIIIAAALFFAIRYMLRERRAGRCAGCPYNNTCEKKDCSGRE